MKAIGLCMVLGLGACSDDGGDKAKTYTDTLTAATNCSAGAGATGTSTVNVDATNSTVTMNVTYSSLSGPVGGGHVHVMSSGAIVWDLGTNLATPITASFTAANYPSAPADTAPATFADAVTALRAGELMVNLHTAACQNGEVSAVIH